MLSTTITDIAAIDRIIFPFPSPLPSSRRRVGIPTTQSTELFSTRINNISPSYFLFSARIKNMATRIIADTAAWEHLERCVGKCGAVRGNIRGDAWSQAQPIVCADKERARQPNAEPFRRASALQTAKAQGIGYQRSSKSSLVRLPRTLASMP